MENGYFRLKEKNVRYRQLATKYSDNMAALKTFLSKSSFYNKNEVSCNTLALYLKTKLEVLIEITFQLC